MFRHLSASELLVEHGDYSKLKPISGKDLKLVIAKQNPEEEGKIDKYLSEKYRFLKAKRVEKVARLSVAEWLPAEEVAHVIHQVSKIWLTIGTKIGNRLLIDPFEIMYLMESNQLELLYNNVSVSIEQARVLISQNEKDFLNQFRVHAQLRRYGYAVLKHNPKRNLSEEPPSKKHESQENHSTTDLNVEIKNNSDNSSGEVLKESIIAENSKICDQELKPTKMTKWGQYKQNLKTELKRKQNEISDIEKSHLKKAKFCKGVPLLKIKERFLNIDEIYQSIQLSKSSMKTCEENHDLSKVNFALDIYKPNSRFKKSTLISPQFRVIILNSSDEMMPCERCLKRKQELLRDNVPTILARVGFDNISYFIFSSIDSTLHS